MAILCIVPNAAMAEEFRKLSHLSAEKLIVEVGLLYDAIPVARHYEDEADVIIGRGGTVLVMQEAGISTPIVEMQVTAGDLARALDKASTLVQREDFRIGVISYPNMTQQLRDFLPFFNLDISLYDLAIHSDIAQIIDLAIKDGMDVLLGGVVTTQVSRGKSIPTILIESGETSFRYALEEAGRIAAARRQKDRRTEELRIITENISEGILATDSEGTIFRMNEVARQLLRNVPDTVVPVRGMRLPPELADLVGTATEIRKVIKLGSKSILADSIPVMVGGSLASSVVTLQETSSIQAMEETIRREIYFKGYVAKFRFEDIVARDPTTRAVVDLAIRYARTTASILIRGESGVGKEVFAQSIHNGSPRSSRAFVAMNCAAIPETLFESELFGYVDGAFTGARKKGKPGLFEIAHGGTVFLDEITEMPLALQARLLRVLQEHQVMRLGDDKILPVDVRIIAATNRNISELVESGGFRTDLYWRLNVLNLAIPPLRERRQDILPLAARMLEETDLCGGKVPFTMECGRFLENYSWPGNIRELKNFCERIAAICDEGRLNADMAMKLLDGGMEHSAPSICIPESATTVEELLETIQKAGGIVQAAQKLGIHRTTLWRKLKRLS